VKVKSNIFQYQKGGNYVLLKNIRKLCQERQTTVAQMEREIGLSNGTISKWATSSPTVNNLKAVADYLGVSMDELLAEDKED
jgi:transcriptional regulator with XRE-family HTH domain